MINVSTWQDLMDMAFAVVSDSAANEVWFTMDRFESWANQCLWEIAEHAKPIDTEIQWSATPGTALYELNSAGHGTLSLWRVEVDDQQIAPVSQSILYKGNRTWRSVTGLPRYFYRDGLNNAADTGLLFGLWPIPSTANSIRAFVSAVPDAVDNDAPTVVIHLPLWAVPGLLWGIMAMAYSSESRVQNLDTAGLFKAMYYDMIDRLKSRSFGKLHEQIIYGSGRSGVRRPGWLGLLPPDGIPYP